MTVRRRFVENPNYAGRKPEILTAACHDMSPMIDVHCEECGDISHIHETQLAQVPPDHAIGMRCGICKHINEFDPGYIADGFAEMRRRGWIA